MPMGKAYELSGPKIEQGHMSSIAPQVPPQEESRKQCPFCGEHPVPSHAQVQYRCGTWVDEKGTTRGDTCRLSTLRLVGGKWEWVPRNDPDHPLNRKRS